MSTQPIDRQLDMLERGELDLGAMVIDDEAKLARRCGARRNLQILHLPDAASLARRLPFARVGHIEAGQIDYVRKLPVRGQGGAAGRHADRRQRLRVATARRRAS